jgi:hypothetical protein
MTPIKRCWRPQGSFLREFARTGAPSPPPAGPRALPAAPSIAGATQMPIFAPAGRKPAGAPSSICATRPWSAPWSAPSARCGRAAGSSTRCLCRKTACCGSCCRHCKQRPTDHGLPSCGPRPRATGRNPMTPSDRAWWHSRSGGDSPVRSRAWVRFVAQAAEQPVARRGVSRNGPFSDLVRHRPSSSLITHTCTVFDSRNSRASLRLAGSRASPSMMAVTRSQL